MTMTPDDIKAIAFEVERRWLERTPAKRLDEVDPASRVQRGEMRLWAEQNNVTFDDCDADLAKALDKLFRKLRIQFSSEKWEKLPRWRRIPTE